MDVSHVLVWPCVVLLLTLGIIGLKELPGGNPVF